MPVTLLCREMGPSRLGQMGASGLETAPEADLGTAHGAVASDQGSHRAGLAG